MTQANEFVAIGEVIKPRGLRGEVLVKSLSDVEDRFESLGGAYVHDGQGERSWFDIEMARPYRGMYIVKFQTVNDRLGARDRLGGRTLEISRQHSPPAGQDEDYYYDLIGLAVYRDDGPLLGTLESIIETGANDVYVVRGEDGAEVLLPATREVILEVDVTDGRMTIHPIAGLLPEAEDEA